MPLTLESGLGDCLFASVFSLVDAWQSDWDLLIQTVCTSYALQADLLENTVTIQGAFRPGILSI